MLFSGEITLKRVNFLNRLLSVGKEEVLRVLRVDTQKGFIDLSKKQVKPDEIEECKQKFGKSKAVEGIVKKLAVSTKKSMEFLYKNIIWPLYKIYEHVYDALKVVLNGDSNFGRIKNCAWNKRRINENFKRKIKTTTCKN